VFAGLHPVIDAPVKCLGVTNGIVRPADLLVDGDNNVRMCLDITVVSPFLASASRPFQVGKAAKDAETKKYKKIQNHVNHPRMILWLVRLMF
jgi:hypothetical protein